MDSSDTTYTYDSDGYCVKKVVGPATNTHAWDRLGASGLGTVVGDGQAEYVHGPAGLQQRTVGAGSQYAHGDGLGSVRLVTDGAGIATGSATYEPWGAPRAGSASLGGFGFTGEQADAETGFVYLRARHYDPATGRFMQAGSWLGAVGSPQSLNRFADSARSAAPPQRSRLIVLDPSLFVWEGRAANAARPFCVVPPRLSPPRSPRGNGGTGGGTGR